MDTRDRIEEVGNNIDTNGKYINDNKKLGLRPVIKLALEGPHTRF